MSQEKTTAQTLLERGKAWTEDALQSTLEGAQRLASSAADTASGTTRQTQAMLKSGAAWAGEALQSVVDDAQRLACGAADIVDDAAKQTRKTLKRGATWTGEALQDAAKDAQRLADRAVETVAAAKRHVSDLWQRQSSNPEEAATIETDKKARLIQLIDELEKHPRDRLRLLGDIGISTTGALAGSAAASILTTTTAVTIGAVAITTTTTPVGWVIGAGVAGAAAAYGISRLIHGGGKSEARMEQLRRNYAKQVRKMEARERQAEVTEDDKTRFIVSMRTLVEQNRLSADSARRLMAAVESGKMPVSRAYRHLESLAGEDPRNTEVI
ncbi:MAG: hypothetical protein LBP58_04195 [Azoarcus sp.]|jgi:hypothetical protein|nr:hypothetical protein [Azoarcus sp.]